MNPVKLLIRPAVRVIDPRVLLVLALIVICEALFTLVILALVPKFPVPDVLVKLIPGTRLAVVLMPVIVVDVALLVIVPVIPL